MRADTLAGTTTASPSNRDLSAQIGRVATAAAKRGAIPVALIVLVVLFLLFQDRFDRNDPKLALAPVYAEPDVPFPGPEEPSR